MVYNKAKYMISGFKSPSLMNVYLHQLQHVQPTTPGIHSHPLTFSSLLKLFAGIKIDN